MDPVNPQTDTVPAQLPPQIAQDAAMRPPARARPRARKACLCCRARKVRCDVSQRGRPCTNCYLDSEPCVVAGRASKHRRAQYDIRDGIQASLPPYAALMRQTNNPDASATIRNPGPAESSNSQPSEEPAGLLDQSVPDMSANFLTCDGDQALDQTAFPDCQEHSATSSSEPFASLQEASIEPLAPGDFTELFFEPNFTSAGAQSHYPIAGNAPGSSEISFYCYAFLKVTNLHQLPQQDAAYLESQGCFKVPMRPFLDEIVQQYFLHIHPFLPLINEGDFWELYHQDLRDPPKEQISVLLLQAMLFAACTFISEPTIQALGYRDIRSMRATFLRRAKSLYDFECESSPVEIAQACVLLTFTSLSSAKKPNTLWLSLAIEHAKLAEAQTCGLVGLPQHAKEKNTLKRLWWCCIIRDRSMSLLLRLPIRITKDQFDFENPLTSQDLEDEQLRSNVYNPVTKLRLAEILSQSIKLYSALTDILPLVLPSKGSQSPLPQEENLVHEKLQECKASLETWRASTACKLGSLQISSKLPKSTNTGRKTNHESVILYTNLMYMYYHTTRIVLCHHQVLQLDLLRTGTGPCYSLSKDLATIFEIRRELQDATSDLAECHTELLRLGLVQWLPSLAIGFILLPLVLNILELKLSPPPRPDPAQTQTVGATQKKLNILIQFMRVYWPRYDGVEWVSEIIRHIVNLVQLDENKIRRRNSSSAINWADIFAFQPRSYLRLVLALDLSLSKGRLPQDWDFPVKLRGLFTFDDNPLKELIEGTCSSSTLERLAVTSPHFETQNSEFPKPMANDGVQNYILGLDDCLIATLEDSSAFGGCMGLPDVPDTDTGSQTDAGSVSDHSEALSHIESLCMDKESTEHQPPTQDC